MTDTIGLAERPPHGGYRLARAMARPRAAAALCVVVLSLGGWIYCGLMVVAAMRAGGAAALGPGMGVLDTLFSPAAAPAWLTALCAVMPTPALSFGAGLLIFAMWAAMGLAMMLPTAAPMLMTYAELCETAQRQGERFVSVWVLAAGYLAVWLGFAVAASALTLALLAAGMLAPSLGAAGRWFAAELLIVAGIYQFTPLKMACLTRCRRPFTVFFANWSETPRAIFRLGVRQGLACLGCCWAAMLLMLAFGLMNVVWMAALGALMAAEKLARGVWFSRAIGVAMIAAGVAIAAVGWVV